MTEGKLLTSSLPVLKLIKNGYIFSMWGHGRDVRDQFLHVETETETPCNQSQFLILRLRLLKLVSILRLRLRLYKLVSKIETDTETLVFGIKK